RSFVHSKLLTIHYMGCTGDRSRYAIPNELLDLYGEAEFIQTRDIVSRCSDRSLCRHDRLLGSLCLTRRFLEVSDYCTKSGCPSSSNDRSAAQQLSPASGLEPRPINTPSLLT